MSRSPNLRFALILVSLGVGWGLTHPLTKIAATSGLSPLGMVFWQLAIGAVALGVVLFRRLGRLPINGRLFAFWMMIALIGTILPNSFGYIAIKHLPAGLISVVMSLIPLMAFPVALAMGNERFARRRLIGLLIGLVGVLFIVIPDAALPDRAALIFLPFALVGPLCYAFEGNIVARWGTHGLDPLEVLFGASVVGMFVALPLAIGSDQFFVLVPTNWPMQAFLIASLIHVFVYTTYVWLVGKTGPVFAGQVSYIVTGAGVAWAIILLNESFGLWFWAAFVLILGGVALVQPRLGIAEAAPESETAAQ